MGDHSLAASNVKRGCSSQINELVPAIPYLLADRSGAGIGAFVTRPGPHVTARLRAKADPYGNPICPSTARQS
jgi:hypothetical protein